MNPCSPCFCLSMTRGVIDTLFVGTVSYLLLQLLSMLVHAGTSHLVWLHWSIQTMPFCLINWYQYRSFITGRSWIIINKKKLKSNFLLYSNLCSGAISLFQRLGIEALEIGDFLGNSYFFLISISRLNSFGNYLSYLSCHISKWTILLLYFIFLLWLVTNLFSVLLSLHFFSSYWGNFFCNRLCVHLTSSQPRRNTIAI